MEGLNDCWFSTKCIDLQKQTVMNREQLIEETFQKVNKLPDEKIREINHFAEFLLSKIEDAIDLEGIAQITSNSQSFDFLHYDEDLYTVNDVIEKYK